MSDVPANPEAIPPTSALPPDVEASLPLPSAASPDKPQGLDSGLFGGAAHPKDGSAAGVNPPSKKKPSRFAADEVLTGHAAGDHSQCDHGLFKKPSPSPLPSPTNSSAVSNASSEAPSPSYGSGSGHIHGPGCGHDYTPSASSGGSVHYHGDVACEHVHATDAGQMKGKSKVNWWAVAGVGAAMSVATYFISEYGRTKKIPVKPTPADWKDRVSQPDRSDLQPLGGDQQKQSQSISLR